MLTVSVFTAISLTTFFLKDQNRVIARLLNDFRTHRGTRDDGRPDFFIDRQNVVEGDGGTDFRVQFFNDDHIVFCDFILFAACFNNCEHFYTIRNSV